MNGKLVKFKAGTIIIAVFFIITYIFITLKYGPVTANWAQLEGQLNKRNDIILNLTNNIKGYALHEKAVFEDIANARSKWAKASTIQEKVEAASGIDSVLARLVLVDQNYPDLKTDQTFLRLMDKLARIQGQIAVEGARYNQSVKSYNMIVKNFPGNFIGRIFGYKAASEYFTVERK